MTLAHSLIGRGCQALAAKRMRADAAGPHAMETARRNTSLRMAL
jgi:hypothetical protein